MKVYLGYFCFRGPGKLCNSRPPFSLKILKAGEGIDSKRKRVAEDEMVDSITSSMDVNLSDSG